MKNKKAASEKNRIKFRALDVVIIVLILDAISSLGFVGVGVLMIGAVIFALLSVVASIALTVVIIYLCLRKRK